MENVYRPELWHDFFIMLGGASAALTGLLFVAISLHLNEIMNSPLLRRRAFNNFFSLGVLIIIAALPLMPQSPSILGGEIFVINVLWMYNPVSLLIRLRRQLDRGAFLRIGTAITSNALAAAGGACLMTRLGTDIFLAGIYLIAFGYLIMLSLVIMNAWSIMTGVFSGERHENRE